MLEGTHSGLSDFKLEMMYKRNKTQRICVEYWKYIVQDDKRGGICKDC